MACTASLPFSEFPPNHIFSYCEGPSHIQTCPMASWTGGYGRQIFHSLLSFFGGEEVRGSQPKTFSAIQEHRWWEAQFPSKELISNSTDCLPILMTSIFLHHQPGLAAWLREPLLLSWLNEIWVKSYPPHAWFQNEAFCQRVGGGRLCLSQVGMERFKH